MAKHFKVTFEVLVEFADDEAEAQVLAGQKLLDASVEGLMSDYVTQTKEVVFGS